MSATTIKSTVRLCGCGCKAQVAGKANYRPGHDARHVSAIAQAAFANPGGTLSAQERIATLPSQALQHKAMSMLDRLRSKQAARDAKASAPIKGTAKVGRWTYEAEMTPGAESLRYRKADGTWIGSTSAKVVASFTAA